MLDFLSCMCSCMSFHDLLEKSDQANVVCSFLFFFWPRDSLLPGGRGREQRAKRARERGQGLKYLSVGLAWSDWLGSYGSCWLEVGAEGGFKLDWRLDCNPGRQDRDPGKQKLKGAVRTETYQHHYCQHSSLFCLLRKGGIVFALASSSFAVF
jgi:hypothetical protein